jgi:Mn2+/Fe2+ NRAMP family transporter
MAREKGYTEKDAVGDARTDNILSTVFVTLATIMTTAAETLNPAGTVPSSAPQFVAMLEPLAGVAAKYLFAIGLFGSVITSLIGASTTSGLCVADAFGKLNTGMGTNLAKGVTLTIVVVMGLVGVVPVYTGVSTAINIYFIASLMTFLSMPICGVLMLKYMANKEMMGELAYGKKMFALAFVLYALVIILFTYNFISTYII